MKCESTIFVALAALCWGLSGGIGGLLLADGWNATVVAFYRGAIGFLFVLLWLILRPDRSGLKSRRLWFWSILAGIGVAGNFAFYFISIAEGSIAVAASLMYCAPVFVYLVSFSLRLERPTWLKWLAIAIVMLGIQLLTGLNEIEAGSITIIGVGAGLLSGLSYAGFIFGFKYAAPHGSPQAILVIAFATLLMILVWLADTNQTAAALSSSSWPLFVALGVLGAGLSFFLYISGLIYAAPAVVSIVAMIEPVTAALFGVMVLDEMLVASQLVGMALILIAVTTLSFHSK